MRLADYVKDKVPVLLLNVTGLFVLAVLGLLFGVPGGMVFLLVLAWMLVGILFFGIAFYQRSRYFNRIGRLLEELDRRYLLAEVMGEPDRLEDKLYREILRKSNKSVIEAIHQEEESRREYKEYIEGWIHEVKTPLTAIHLMCENHRDELTKRILGELETIENQVEQVLYYARMEETYRDYLVHPIDLRKTVLSAIGKEKCHFLQCKMQISEELEPIMVSTDEKWVEFLLRQIFSNCIKYRRKQGPKIRIYTRRGEKQLQLVIEDNGIGIAPEDLERIFDKGFSGKNGRREQASTGIGLYLCKSLCNKLGLGIGCESREGEYTRLILVFPDTDYHKSFQK